MEVVTTVTTKTYKDKPELFLSNTSEDGNPIITALVQTPRIIDYSDIGEGEYEYTDSAIRNSITDLIGYQVEDEEHKSGSDKSFATITNAGYCPDYGGYVEMEVFKPEYHDLMQNIAKNMEKGVMPKKRFSTEVFLKDTTPLGDNKYRIDSMGMDGLIWTKMPRDDNTGICSVKLNKKSIENNRRDKMTDGKVKEQTVSLEDYMTLETKYRKLKEDYSEGSKAYETLMGKFKEGKGLYDETLTEVEDLKGQLKPIWEAEEQERTSLLEKVVANAKEDEQEGLRKSLENQSKEELTILLNAMAPANKGAVKKPAQKKSKEEDLTVEQVWKDVLGRD